MLLNIIQTLRTGKLRTMAEPKSFTYLKSAFTVLLVNLFPLLNLRASELLLEPVGASSKELAMLLTHTLL